MRIEPISSLLDALNSCSRKAFSIRSSLPQAPTTRRNVSRAPRAERAARAAGSSVPGQRSTGTAAAAARS